MLVDGECSIVAHRIYLIQQMLIESIERYFPVILSVGKKFLKSQSFKMSLNRYNTIVLEWADTVRIGMNQTNSLTEFLNHQTIDSLDLCLSNKINIQ